MDSPCAQQTALSLNTPEYSAHVPPSPPQFIIITSPRCDGAHLRLIMHTLVLTDRNEIHLSLITCLTMLWTWGIIHGTLCQGQGTKALSHTHQLTARVQQKKGMFWPCLNIHLKWSDDKQTVSAGLFNVPLHVSPESRSSLHWMHVCISLVAMKMYLTWLISVYIGTFSLWKGWTGHRQQRGDCGKHVCY